MIFSDPDDLLFQDITKNCNYVLCPYLPERRDSFSVTQFRQDLEDLSVHWTFKVLAH